MHYTKFTVCNFRCFREVEELLLAQPVLSKPGSGITYIVGANNAGKTTLIESLWIKADHYLNDSDRQASPPEFKLYKGDTVTRLVSLLRDNSCLFIETPPRKSVDDLFEIVSSRRHWDSGAAGNTTLSAVVKASTVGESPRTQQTSVQTALYLKVVERDPEKYREFTEFVQRIIPEFTEWSVGFENQPYIKYISSEGVSHKADLLGDGVISVIRILAHLYEDSESGLIIDEPELSLHPLAQKKLIKLIAECAEKRQIIISTHSPYFVSWEYLKNGATLNRVAKLGDTRSKIFTLQDYSKYNSLIKGANWQQPFLMDVASKEIFFQDNILFLEGQEDVGLLRKSFSDTDINLFGYGVRGFSKFDLSLQLAKDLGIKKACVLLDKGYEESEEKKRLEERYSEYEILQSDKTDIRDKEAYGGMLAKEGYFDSDGKLQSSEENSLDNLLGKIKLYFSGA